MKIGEYLAEKNIIMDLKSESKEDAIREIAGLLRDAREINDFEKFIFDVFAREKVQTTGIGHAVAIPHARTDATEDFIIAFGISRNGIDFESADGKLVKLIFLIGTPETKKLSMYLKVLGHLSRLLNKEDFRNKLLSASGAKDIIGEFRKIEQ